MFKISGKNKKAFPLIAKIILLSLAIFIFSSSLVNAKVGDIIIGPNGEELQITKEEFTGGGEGIGGTTYIEYRNVKTGEKSYGNVSGITSQHTDAKGKITTTGGGSIAGWVLTLAASMWHLLFYIIRLILSLILFVVSFFLDNIFSFNVVLNPSNMDVVKDAWAVMRDIANSFFILLVLWIAFTIIFGIEKYGGKTLLARVIIFALLTNFSLAMVSGVFGLTNALAMPMKTAVYKLTGGGDIAGFIVDKIKLQKVTEGLSGKNKDLASVNQQGACVFDTLSPGTGNECNKKVSTGVDELNKIPYQLKEALSIENEAINSVIMAFSAGLADVFLLLVIIALVVASINLVIRLVVMVFTAVLAPVAFVASLIPSAKVKQIWTKWLTEMFCWAFYAPAFYFLFWLSLLLLATMTKNIPSDVDTILGLFMYSFIPFVVFFAFLWVSVRVGKYIGCAGADFAINLGQQALGLAVGATAAAATGGTSMAMGALTRRAAPQIEAGLQKVSEIPVLRNIAAPITGRITGYMESQRRGVGEKRKQLEGMTSEHIAQRVESSLDVKEKVAGAQILSERGKKDIDLLKPGTQQRVANMARQFGEQSSILKGNPSLATSENVPNLPSGSTKADAVIRVVEKMTPEEKTKIAPSATKDPLVVKALLMNARSSKELAKLGQENLAILKSMKDAWKDNIDGIKEKVAGSEGGETRVDMLNKYFAGNMGQTLTRISEEKPAFKEVAGAYFGEAKEGRKEKEGKKAPEQPPRESPKT